MAKEKSKGLGKGLGALFGGDVSLDALTHPPVSTAVEEQEPPVQEEKQTSEENTLQMLPIDSIHENPWQPRRDFDADALLDLTESIHEKGVLLLLSSHKKTATICSSLVNAVCAQQSRLVSQKCQ